jgi:hypothetical protein
MMATPHQQRSVTMNDQETPFTSSSKYQPWNKGKFAGAKPPLRPKHVALV